MVVMMMVAEPKYGEIQARRIAIVPMPPIVAMSPVTMAVPQMPMTEMPMADLYGIELRLLAHGR